MLEIKCTWCSLSDKFKKIPEDFKCPYCGNRKFYPVSQNKNSPQHL